MIYPRPHIHHAYARAVALGASHDEAVSIIASVLGIAEEAVREVVTAIKEAA